VEQAVGQHRCGGEEQTDGLIAIEGFALGAAAGDALLLDGVTFELVVHGLHPLSTTDAGKPSV